MLYRVCDRPRHALGVLMMAPYLGIGSNVLTMVLATSVSVSNRAYNNLVDSTHTIGSSAFIQMMIHLSLDTNRTT